MFIIRPGTTFFSCSEKGRSISKSAQIYLYLLSGSGTRSQFNVQRLGKIIRLKLFQSVGVATIAQVVAKVSFTLLS